MKRKFLSAGSIHVCYGFHDTDGHYAKFAGTSILSIFENTKSNVTIHILHDNTLTEDNRKNFDKLAKDYRQKIKFYNLEILIPDKVEEIKIKMPAIATHRLGIGTVYRLIIANVISNDIEKIIYLDSGDTLINCDIRALWNVKLNDLPIAAIPETVIGTNPKDIPMCSDGIIGYDEYFNAGVLILNLDYFRKNLNVLDKGYKFLRDNPKYPSLDQDILNYCFSTNYLKLTKDFNTYVCWQRRDNVYKIENVIYHYNSSPLGIGINLDTTDVYSNLYLEYFTKTPWFNVEALGNLFKSICRLYGERQNFSIQITKLLAGRSRAFFANHNDLEILKQVFFIDPDELTINASIPPNQSVELLVKAMHSFKSQKVFFLFVGYYDSLRNLLIQQNFVEGRDFVNGNMFFQNNPQRNSYFLVRAM